MATVELGEFLRTRRARVAPEVLGISSISHRRVSGLRRDEVAADAGLSVDYYRRIEQGREPHPSKAVLASLSRTMRMSVNEQRHLYALAGVSWRLDDNAPARRVPHELTSLLQSWHEAGAIVLDPVLDLVICNKKATDLFSGFSSTGNLLEMVLLDPYARRFFVEWTASAEATVANLRASADFAGLHARFRELLVKLRRESPEFPAMWDRHDVKPKTHESKELRHHRHGLLTVDFHAFGVVSAPGYQLLVYQEQADRVARG